MPKIVVDYYTVTVGPCADLPRDAFRDDRELLQAAIDLAKDRARLYCIPASWQADFDRTGNVRVRRWRHAPQK